MKHIFTTTAVLIALFWTVPVLAQHQHGGMSGMPGMGEGKKPESNIGNETSPNRTFLLEGGIKAAFSMMTMAGHKKMLKDMNMKAEMDPQATHNIAVALTDTATNTPVGGAVVKMKVIDPNGKDQVKLLDYTPLMNQYGGDFILPVKGKYQILILFKAGGKKEAAGFYYLLK